MEIFWKTIALYNASTWIYQLLLMIVGCVTTFTLIIKPSRWTRLGMKIYLILLYLWISIVYYYIDCAARSYNEILALFWGVMVVIWIWDAITGYTTFERTKKYDKLSYFLMILPFFYPIISICRGMTFPEMTSPLMPSAVVTFTIGLLLLHSKKVNIFMVLFLCHWSLIGLTKTYFFNIPEDFIAASASIPALYLFFREYYLNNLSAKTKPSARIINWLLIFVCAGLGIVLISTLLLELVPKR